MQRGRSTRWGWRWRAAVALLVTSPIAGLAPPAATGAAAAAPAPLSVDLTGTNGVATAITDGRSCADGGAGDYRNHRIEGPLAAGRFSSLPGTLRANLQTHTDGSGAFLGPDASHLTLSNTRGAVRLALAAGSCPTPAGPAPAAGESATFGPVTGTWTVDPSGSTGAYREATSAGGGFTLTTGVAPGADNPWRIQLSGSLQVLQPTLRVTPLRAFWASLGVDYLSRRVSVTYEIANTGPGDAYNAQLTGVQANTPGVTPITGLPIRLGDLAVGETAVVTLRYQLGLLQPCQLLILGCYFTSTLTVDLPDALDVVSRQSAPASVKAPDLPPPF